VALIVAAALGLALTPLAGAVARRLGIVDRPGPLKVQRAPVPYLGGLAVALAATPGLVAARPSIAAPLAAALAIGTADDVRGLSPRTRLVGAVLTGALAAAVAPGATASRLGVAAAVVVLVNAVNLLDGLDALAGAVSVSSFATLAVLASGDGRTVALAFCGATLAFLAYNRPPARIYLGDGGAWVLGTAAALAAASAWEGRGAAAVPASFLAVAVPLVDTTTAVVRRWRAHRPLFAGDRSHIYDQLLDRGWTVGRVVLAFALGQAALGLAALGVAHAPFALAAGAVALGAVALGAAVARGGFLGATTPAGGSP
jgi:UDP-GlcNAc:undecaprenyl-phosphate GlcNAc-1-phosphate transferase